MGYFHYTIFIIFRHFSAFVQKKIADSAMIAFHSFCYYGLHSNNIKYPQNIINILKSSVIAMTTFRLRLCRRAIGWNYKILLCPAKTHLTFTRSKVPLLRRTTKKQINVCKSKCVPNLMAIYLRGLFSAFDSLQGPFASLNILWVPCAFCSNYVFILDLCGCIWILRLVCRRLDVADLGRL